MSGMCVCARAHGQIDICRGMGEMMPCGPGKETYSSDVQRFQGKLIHAATFKIVLQVVVRDKKVLLDGVRFIAIELDEDGGISAGPREIPRLHADVIAVV